MGSGLNIESSYSRMIVDIGFGVTDMAVFRCGRIYCSTAIRVACAAAQSAVCRFASERYGVRLHPHEAERLLVESGTRNRAGLLDIPVASGLDARGEEAGARFTDRDLQQALDPVLTAIAGRTFEFLKDLPAATAVEVIEDGIWLTGGGAGLYGAVERIGAATDLDVKTVPDPLHAVVKGAAAMLEMLRP